MEPSKIIDTLETDQSSWGVSPQFCPFSSLDDEGGEI